MKKTIFLSLLLILLIVLTSCSGAYGGEKTKKDFSEEQISSFAKCLTENDAVFYGTDWCPHCKDQKKMFGNAMDDIVFVDCDENKKACVDAGIEGYPTWKIKGQTLVGTQTFYKLSKASGCPLN